MKRIIIILLLISLSGCTSLMPHPRSWSKQEKVAAIFFMAAHTANALSTERHQDEPHLYYESNFLLGRHPSDREITGYFSITGLITLLYTHLYPETRIKVLIGYGVVNTGLTIYDYNMVRK